MNLLPISIRDPISGESLKRFYRSGSVNITASGSVFVDVGSNSFVVPFHNTTTIFLETGGVNHVILLRKYNLQLFCDRTDVVK